MRLLERKEPPRELPRCAPSAPSLPREVYVSGELLCAGSWPEEDTSALSVLGRAPAAIGCVDWRGDSAHRLPLSHGLRRQENFPRAALSKHFEAFRQ